MDSWLLTPLLLQVFVVNLLRSCEVESWGTQKIHKLSQKHPSHMRIVAAKQKAA